MPKFWKKLNKKTVTETGTETETQEIPMTDEANVTPVVSAPDSSTEVVVASEVTAEPNASEAGGVSVGEQSAAPPSSDSLQTESILEEPAAVPEQEEAESSAAALGVPVGNIENATPSVPGSETQPTPVSVAAPVVAPMVIEPALASADIASTTPSASPGTTLAGDVALWTSNHNLKLLDVVNLRSILDQMVEDEKSLLAEMIEAYRARLASIRAFKAEKLGV